MSFFGQGAPHREYQPEGLGYGPTYLEYLEFNYNEFAKFKRMPPVTQEEIDKIDLDELCKQLLQ